MIVLEMMVEDIGICQDALIWAMCGPFEKTARPTLPLREEDVDGLLHRLTGLWKPLIASDAPDSGREWWRVMGLSLAVSLQEVEIRCIVESFDSVLRESAWNPDEFSTLMHTDVEHAREVAAFMRSLLARASASAERGAAPDIAED
jgi:hypothetical protein